MAGYSSDDSSLVNGRSRHSRRRERHRSASRSSYGGRRRSYNSQEPHEETAQNNGLIKAAIAVGIISAITLFLQSWTVKRNTAREQEARRQRRRDFERRKAERRRNEAKWERQSAQEEYEDDMLQRQRRQIGYVPRSRSRSRSPRMIEAPRPGYQADTRDTSVATRYYGEGNGRPK